MPASADLYCRVDAFDGADLELRVQIQNDVTDPDGLFLEAEIDGTAGAMAVPVTLSRQAISKRVYIDGVLVPNLVACRTTLARDKNLQGGEFTVPIAEGGGGYDGVFLGRGSNLRKRRIDVFGAYLTSTGYHEVPLITNGICNGESREQSNGALITFEFVDRGGRYDQVLSDLVVNAGSGLTRDRVVAIAARRAGVEDISLETSDTVMNHEFQMVDANFITACQEMADVEGRVIQWDRQGNMIWRRYGSTNLLPSRPVWSFTERNFVKGSCKLAQPGELITEITVEGDEQVLSGPCGDSSTVLTITTTGLIGPTAPAFAQGTGSAYGANTGPSPWTEPKPVQVETFVTTRRCGVVVYEKRTLQQYYNPEVDRYDYDAVAHEWVTLGSVYTNDDTDDDSPAYRYPVDAWLTTEIDETWHYWMRQGFEGPDATLIPMNPTGLDMGYGLRAPKGWDGLLNGEGWYRMYDPIKFDGIKIGTLSTAQRWYAVREYVKQRADTFPLDLWDEVEPVNDYRVLGSKEGATDGGEVFRQVSQEVNIFGTDGRGYQTDDDVYRFSYLSLPGVPYQYGDGFESLDDVENLRYTGSTYTHFVGSGTESHDEYESETDYSDRTTTTVTSKGLESYLPAADRIPDSGPPTDSDVYEDDAELTELYRRAYRTESKPISVTVTDDELEGNSTRGVHKVHSQYIENEDEADWLARYLLEEGAAGHFDGALAGANFFVEPGDECSTVRYRKLGLAGMPGRIESVTWDWQAGQTINTDVEILLYPST